MQNFNKFLQGFRTETLAKAAKAASIEKLDLIVSSVNGEFTGLKGRTVIRLANGTAWRQANPEDNYKGAGRPGEYVNLPAVVMKKGLFGYKDANCRHAGVLRHENTIAAARVTSAARESR